MKSVKADEAKGATRPFIAADIYMHSEASVEELIRLANQGDARVQFFLGSMYHSGKGVRQDIKMAKEFFGKVCDITIREVECKIG